MQKRQGNNLLILYPATLAKNVIGLEGMVTEAGRVSVSIPAGDWLLNTDGLYVCSLSVEGLRAYHDVDVILLPTGRSAVTLMGGVVGEGSVTLISGTLPSDTADMTLIIKETFGQEDGQGVVAVLNARGVMGAVYV